tara:strand:+ start:189 stop:734 length:546 start_codon:yes stop_codon:yes gene_type:complete
LENVKPMQFRTDYNVEFRGPHLISTNSAVNSATSIARLYNDEKNDLTSSSTASGATTLVADNPSLFQVGDILIITLDDQTLHSCGAITEISLSQSTIKFTTALASIASIGARLGVQLGANISMLLYGSPVVKQYNWGFRGIIPYNHVGLRIGQIIRIEIDFTTSAGAKALSIIRTSIIGGS